jgi:hypothetical protein
MPHLGHKHKQNSMIVITATTTLRFSLNGGELLWYY